MRGTASTVNLLRKLFYSIYYLRRPPWDTGISPPELLEFIAGHAPGRALDLGCGTGTNAITLARSGWQTVGVDFVAKAVRRARRKAKAAGVQVDFYTADVTRLPGEILKPDPASGAQPRRFDLVLDIGCFHSLDAPGKQRYLDQLPRLLAPGGTFMLYGFVHPEEARAIGVNPSDLRAIESRLDCIHRQDGIDRGRAASAWMTFTLGSTRR